jgi:class 3 adenylate cyclase
VSLDPEELHEVAEDYYRMGAGIVRRFDGYIVSQDQGERLVVYFGYPQAHEDNARRAMHTGLGIVEAMADLNRRCTRDQGKRLGVQIGIHTGVVVVGVRGQDKREVLTLGNTSMIAHQVQCLAVPDTVAISSTTRRLIERYVDTQPLGAYRLDDPAEPLVVYQILQGRTSQNLSEGTVTPGRTPLVGREQEIQLLRERWAQVQDGWGQGVLLSGEAGIGKSRLVQALTEHLTEEVYTRIVCRASPYYQQSAFYPVVEHLQRLLQFRRDDTPEEKLHKLEAMLGAYDFAREEVVPLFAVLLSLPLAECYTPLALTPERQKQKLLEALVTWLLRETERQPVCLIMEDLHWVDPSTLEWLSLLIDQIPTTRVLLLLTFRPDFQPPWAVRSHLTHLTLGRLSPRQTERMIGQVVENKLLPAEVMQQVVATTDGVPLFIEELTKMVVELGLVTEREGRYELTGPLPALAIPATLHDSLMARLDRLGAAKRVAQLAAVIGRKFAYEVLEAVWPGEEGTLQQGLARLIDADLLYQRGLLPQARYVFKHALIQEAAYHSMLRSTRRSYHCRIVQILEERFPEICESHPELVAHHTFRGERWEQAVASFRQAGAQALARSAHREAVGCFEYALAALQHLPETPDTWGQAIDLHFHLRNAFVPLREYAQIWDHLHTAQGLAEALHDDYRLGQACVYLTEYFRQRGDAARALASGEQARALATALGDDTLDVIATFCVGLAYYDVGDYRQAADCWRSNVVTLTGARLHERFGLGLRAVMARAWLASSLADLGEFTEGAAR